MPVTFQSTTLASPPVNTVVATDTITGNDFQIIKLAFGATGTATAVTASVGLPIGDGTNTISIQTSGSDGASDAVNIVRASARNMVFNGTTWDRVRGDVANGMDVDVTRLPAAAVAQQTDVIRNGTASLTPQFAAISASASGDTQVVAAQAGQRIRVLGYRFQAGADVDVRFRSAANPLTGAMPTGAKGGGGGAAFCPIGHFQTNVNEALNINLSATVPVGGHVVFVVV